MENNLSARSAHFLDSLLYARSVAVVGASDSGAKMGGRVLGFLLRYGYDGKIFPLNPNSKEIFGLQCYPDIRSLPEAPDVAIMAIPKQLIFDSITQCIERHVKNAVIITAGFAEIGEAGRADQEKLNSLIQGTSLRVVGPNVIGVISRPNRMPIAATAGLDAGVLLDGSIGFVSQSGAMAGSFFSRAQDRNLGLRYMVSVGNELDLEMSDFIEYMIDDPDTSAIVCFIEGIRKPRRFIEVAEKASNEGKPIIVLKIGCSERGSRAAQSHTASLTGSDATYGAIFKQKGIIRVETFDGLLETAMLFAKAKSLVSEGLGVISASGGACGFLSDRSAAVGLKLPDLSPAVAANIAETMGLASVQNPIDTGGQQTGQADIMARVLAAYDSDPKIGAVLAALATSPNLERAGEALAVYARTGSKPVIAITLAGSVALKATRHLDEANVPVLSGTDETFKAIKCWFWQARFQAAASERAETPAGPPAQDVTKLRADLAKKHGALTEPEAKQILAVYGIPITNEVATTSAAEAAAAASRIGFPVALKIVSPEITHKTEAKGIQLNLTTEAAVEAAYDRIVANALAYRPEAHIEGVLVQEMISDGLETIAGMSKDPDFGPTIVFGLGGIFVELLRDVAVRQVPLNRWDAREIVREVRSYPVLEGVRGQSRRDILAVEDIILKLSRLAADLGDLIEEIDLNPLMVLADGAGAKVVDALVILKARTSM
jgi:acetyltransferase